ncbi:hypothetical protein NCC49_003879 [Naganishia albida]|nr:hypothetical protein NCC49_003879 [Naganishia albida]
MYHPPTLSTTYDPNFPPELNITPSQHPANVADEHDQLRNIGLYGIAGKVWDASYPILPYLTASSDLDFNPPCSIFTQDAPVILELGSGQSLASLHLLTQLQRRERNAEAGGERAEVFLTDLESVLPLAEENIERWRRKSRGEFAVSNGDSLNGNGNNGNVPNRVEVDVRVHALPWGDSPAAERLHDTTGRENMGITHIIMIDLIYFPHLYPPLMKTLLQITAPPFSALSAPSEATTGPGIILSYKSRSLEFEQPFFHSFQQYFQMTPLLSRPRQAHSAEDGTAGKVAWRVHGREEGVYTYICRRWRDTVPGAAQLDRVPAGEGRAKRQGGSWGWEEAQLAGIEWD